MIARTRRRSAPDRSNAGPGRGPSYERLVDQRRWLQRVTRTLVSEIVPGHLSELLVHERRQPRRLKGTRFEQTLRTGGPSGPLDTVWGSARSTCIPDGEQFVVNARAEACGDDGRCVARWNRCSHTRLRHCCSSRDQRGCRRHARFHATPPAGGDPRALPRRCAPRRRGHGRGLSRAQDEVESRCRAEGVTRIIHARSGSAGALHARGPRARVAQSSQHRRDARC